MITSVVGMLKLLKAARSRAIKDKISRRRGADPWKEWKKSECRYIYYNCFILMKEVNDYKSRYNSIPKIEGRIKL